MIPISEKEFAQFQRFILEAAGISLSHAKKQLVCGRLSRRLQHHKLRSYGDYFNLLQSGRIPAEIQIAVDLLTTNETHLFREPRHFDLLRQLALQRRGRAQLFRVWSAACSSGEEPYSIAMVLNDCLPEGGWEVLGSDISTRMLERAQAGHYPLDRARHVPVSYLRRYCLRGIGSQAGTLLVSRAMRQKVLFRQINLNQPLPRVGPFDVIFLRNVMIYFNTDTKRQILARVADQLREGGYLLTGHSESLSGCGDGWLAEAPAVYRKR
jgi:chemotaxis protein methyltransferase CheR